MIKQHSIRFAFLFFVGLVVASASLTGCTKKDDNLVADYNAKKAAADKLVTDAGTGGATMKADDQKWMGLLDSVAKTPGADSSKIAGFRKDIHDHETDMATAMADVDSIKLYDNAPMDDNAKLMNANDRLGSNFDDLNSKWKALSDNHAKIQSNILAYLASPGTKATTEKPAAEKAEPKSVKKAAVQSGTPEANTTNHTPGVAKKSAGSSNKN